MAEEAEEDEESKTEDPTPRKLEEAIKQGNVVNSKEVTNFLIILSLALVILWIMPYSSFKITSFLQSLIANSHDINLTNNFRQLIIIISKNILIYISVPLLITFFVAILSSFMQQGGQFIISTNSIEPSLSKISPVAGWKRIFSIKSLIEFIKSFFKILIMAFISYKIIMADISLFKIYHQYESIFILKKVYEIINHLMIYVCIFLFFTAVVDYFYQRFEYIKSLKMTKQEMKEEFKNTEGNPEIKQKIRSIRIERVKNQIAANVPKADVIITNPTHYSIALQYDAQKMSAPIIIAKGVDNIALKIREIAKEHDIPLIENKPLARSLYEIEINNPIPVEHYDTVAEIITYVYKLKKKKQT